VGAGDVAETDPSRPVRFAIRVPKGDVGDRTNRPLERRDPDKLFHDFVDFRPSRPSPMITTTKGFP